MVSPFVTALCLLAVLHQLWSGCHLEGSVLQHRLRVRLRPDQEACASPTLLPATLLHVEDGGMEQGKIKQDLVVFLQIYNQFLAVSKTS